MSVITYFFLSQNTLRFLGLAFYATFQGSRRFSVFIIIFASRDEQHRRSVTASLPMLKFDHGLVFGKFLRFFLLTSVITEKDPFAILIAEGVIGEEHISLSDENLDAIL
jgi:hypothetical protein